MSAGTPDNSFRVQQQWKLGGEGGWDRLAIDDQFHRLYVTRSNRVTVVDTGTGKTVGEITGLNNVHSVCLDTSGKYGFITDGAASVVVVFDRSTLQSIASIPAGENPDAAVFDSAAGSLFVFNRRGNSATVIDLASNRRLDEIALGGTPAAAVSDGIGFVYVTLEDTHQIARIDTRSHQLTAKWPIPSCSGLTGLALDETHRSLYAVCDYKKLVMVDVATGRVVADAALVQGTRDVTYDAKRNLVFAANGGGTLSILQAAHPGRLSILQTVKTQLGASSLAFDPKSGRIYLPAAQFGLRTGAVSEELRFRPTPVAGSFMVLVLTD